MNKNRRYTRHNHPVRIPVASVVSSGTLRRTVVLDCGHARLPMIRDNNQPIHRGDLYPCVVCPLPKEATD